MAATMGAALIKRRLVLRLLRGFGAATTAMVTVGCGAGGELTEAKALRDTMRECAEFALDGSSLSDTELRLIIVGCTSEDERYRCTEDECSTMGDTIATIRIDNIIDEVLE